MEVSTLPLEFSTSFLPYTVMAFSAASLCKFQAVSTPLWVSPGQQAGIGQRWVSNQTWKLRKLETWVI